MLHGELQLYGGYRKVLEVEAFTEEPSTYSGAKILLHVQLHNYYSGKPIKLIKLKLRRQLFYGSNTAKQTVVKLKRIFQCSPWMTV